MKKVDNKMFDILYSNKDFVLIYNLINDKTVHSEEFGNVVDLIIEETAKQIFQKLREISWTKDNYRTFMEKEFEDIYMEFVTKRNG
jgi:hypothetical protein